LWGSTKKREGKELFPRINKSRFLLLLHRGGGRAFPTGRGEFAAKRREETR